MNQICKTIFRRAPLEDSPPVLGGLDAAFPAELEETPEALEISCRICSIELCISGKLIPVGDDENEGSVLLIVKIAVHSDVSGLELLAEVKGLEA